MSELETQSVPIQAEERGGAEQNIWQSRRVQLTPSPLLSIRSAILPRLEYALHSLPSLSSLPLIQAVSMISHYPLATLLPWPAGPHQHCPDLDCSLLLEGEGGVALQRYQARSPESSPRHWVSARLLRDCVRPPSAVCLSTLLWWCYFHFLEAQVLPVLLNNLADAIRCLIRPGNVGKVVLEDKKCGID